MATVTAALRTALERCGKTRYAISKATGIPESTLSRFVAGGKPLRGENIDKLSQYLALALMAKPGTAQKRACSIALTLWHVTKESSGKQIMAGGFRDGPFRGARHLQGVYFADRPTWDGQLGVIPPGWVGIAVVFDSEREVAKYEVTEEPRGASHREWFIPAEVVNKAEFYMTKGR